MWKEVIQVLCLLRSLKRIAPDEFDNLKQSTFDIIDKKRMDDDTWFRTSGKVTGKKVIFY